MRSATLSRKAAFWRKALLVNSAVLLSSTTLAGGQGDHQSETNDCAQNSSQAHSEQHNQDLFDRAAQR